MSKKNHQLFFVLFFILNFFLLIRSDYQDGGDDLFFKQSASQYSTTEFISYRYQNWSGRIIPDTLSLWFNNQPKIIWVFFNSIAITAMAFLLWQYLNLFNPKTKKHSGYLLLIFFSFLFLDKSIFEPSFIWLTGSLNYLWPTLIGLITFYPFLFFLIKKKIPKNIFLFITISILSGLMTEQVSLALLGFMFLSFFYFILSHQRLPISLVAISLFTVIGSAILFLAPGNQIRYQSETNHNFPGFDSLSLANHISISFYWIINKMVNFLPLPLALIFSLLGTINLQQKQHRTISIFSLAIAFILLIKFLFRLNCPIYPITSDNILSVVNLLKYLITITSLSIIPYLIVKTNINHKFIYLSLFSFSLILMFIVTLSPTLDASGSRTIFLPGMLYLLLGLFLSSETLK